MTHNAYNARGLAPPRPAKAARTRGLAFVVTLAVIVIIASVLMVLARRVQTESLASSNHASATEARWIAEGVARALLVELASEPRRANIDGELEWIEADAAELGDGLYWLLRPDPENAQRHDFGIVSEAGKLNINTADARTLEALHPDVTPAIAESIVGWRGDGGEDGDITADAGYYLAQARPYRPKEAPFETIGELLLVRDIDRALLYGQTRAARHDFDATPAATPRVSIGRGFERGLHPFITVFSREPNYSFELDRDRLNINSVSVQDLAEAVNDADDADEALSEVFDEARAAALLQMFIEQRPYENILDLIAQTQMSEEEAAIAYDYLTTTDSTTRTGLVDVARAPAEVIEALPGLSRGDGERVAQARRDVSDPTASPHWLLEALGQEKAVAIGDAITTRSFQFAADVLAISGDGRAFHRLRVIIDIAPAIEGGQPRILHNEDLTHHGWPLNDDIREALRAGEPAADVARRYRGREGGW